MSDETKTRALLPFSAPPKTAPAPAADAGPRIAKPGSTHSDDSCFSDLSDYDEQSFDVAKRVVAQLRKGSRAYIEGALRLWREPSWPRGCGVARRGVWG